MPLRKSKTRRTSVRSLTQFPATVLFSCFLSATIPFTPANANVVEELLTKRLPAAAQAEVINSATKVFLSKIAADGALFVPDVVRSFVINNFDNISISVSKQVQVELQKSRTKIGANILASIIVDAYVDFANEKIIADLGYGAIGATTAAVNEHVIRLGANIVMSGGNPADVAVAQAMVLANVGVDLVEGSVEAVQSAYAADLSKIKSQYAEARLIATKRIMRGENAIVTLRAYDEEITSIRNSFTLKLGTAVVRGQFFEVVDELEDLHFGEIRDQLWLLRPKPEEHLVSLIEMELSSALEKEGGVARDSVHGDSAGTTDTTPKETVKTDVITKPVDPISKPEEPPTETNTAELRLASEQEKQAELDLREAERLEQEQDGISNQLTDAQARLQEARNQLAASRFNDLEIVDRDLNRVRLELAALSRRAGDQTETRELGRERSILINGADVVRQLYLGRIYVNDLTRTQRNRLTLMGRALGYTTASGKPIWETVAENARFTAQRIVGRVNALDNELSNLNPLSSSEQRRLNELGRTERRLANDKREILATINRAERDIERYQGTIASLEGQFSQNEQRLAQLGYDIENYAPPNFVTGPQTDWASYESNYTPLEDETVETSDEGLPETPIIDSPSDADDDLNNQNTIDVADAETYNRGIVAMVNQSAISTHYVARGSDVVASDPNVGDSVEINFFADNERGNNPSRVDAEAGTISGQFDYMSWGEWTGSVTIFNSGVNVNTDFNRGYFLVGNPTDTTVVENKTGTANYAGNLIGDYATPTTGVIANSVSGTVNITADFSNDTVSGNMNMTGPNGFAAVPTFSGNFVEDPGVITGYQANMTAANGSGITAGYFYGPSANETGGVFFFNSNLGENATGIFQAK